MPKTQAQIHDEYVQRFIKLANDMKDSGSDPALISRSLMTASGIYATYLVAGNDGGLNETGIDKVAASYREGLAKIQEVKRAQLK